MYDILELNNKLLTELREIAKGLKIKRVESHKKQDLIYKILDAQAIVVSETKAAKKESPKREAPKRESQKKGNDTEKTEEEAPKPKRRPGRPKKREKTRS